MSESGRVHTRETIARAGTARAPYLITCRSGAYCIAATRASRSARSESCAMETTSAAAAQLDSAAAEVAPGPRSRWLREHARPAGGRDYRSHGESSTQRLRGRPHVSVVVPPARRRGRRLSRRRQGLGRWVAPRLRGAPATGRVGPSLEFDDYSGLHRDVRITARLGSGSRVPLPTASQGGRQRSRGGPSPRTACTAGRHNERFPGTCFRRARPR